MANQEQQRTSNRSVQEILDSANNKNVPATADSSTSQKTSSNTSSNSNPKLADIEKRRAKDDIKKQKQKESEDKELSEKEKALAKIREQNEKKVQQFRKKKLLAGCEPVMGLNYDVLAMDNYPESALVAAARRDRDYWLAVSTVCACVFALGVIEVFAAWISGVAIGLFFVSIMFAFTPMRKWFFDRPTLHELLRQRKAVEFTAINHIMFLEGVDGLAWRCGKMHKYNHNLARNMFDGVQRFSRERSLKSVLASRKHIRLYLLFMMEAQKAYKRLQKDYLKNHFEHMEQGWDDTITEAEERRLSQELEMDDDDLGKD